MRMIYSSRLHSVVITKSQKVIGLKMAVTDVRTQEKR